MIEKQQINGKEVWIKVDPQPAERENPNIIPTEYFTAAYFLQEPANENETGQLIMEDNEPKLFESPVAALTHAQKTLEKELV